MIQSATNPIASTSRGFENLVRISPQRPMEGGDGSAARVSDGASQLTPEQEQAVDALKQQDRRVRAHEHAHVAVGGELVRGGPSFTYETGPDNRRYAVAGEVAIDTTPGRTPEETVPKAQRIRATALAPADPSPQDRTVAAQASRMEGRARAELVQQRSGAAEGSGIYNSAGRDNDRADRVGVRLDLYV